MAEISKTIPVVFIVSMLLMAIFSPVFKPVYFAAAQDPAFSGDVENPLALKLNALAQLGIVNGSHSDEIAFSQAGEYLNHSVNNDFWDDYHIRDALMITGDLVVIKRLESTKVYKNGSNPGHGALVSCITYLTQSDRRLADISISDARNASYRITDSKILKLMNASIDRAVKEQATAESYLESIDLDHAVEHYRNAWAQANVALLLADGKISPIVTIINPVNGTYVSTQAINVSGTVDDVAVYSMGNVTISVNGRPLVAPLSNGTFSQPMQLREGVNNIKVTATDLLNNKGVGSSQVTLDSVNPVITITGVSDGGYYNTSVQPSVTINDVNLGSSSIFLDGTPYAGIPVGGEGSHSLRVEAEDLAGNTANLTVDFVIDHTSPVALLYGVQDNGYLGRTVLLDGGMADVNPGNLSLRIDGIEVSGQLPYMWNTSEYGDGNHTVELFVTDKALNTGSTSIQVIVDNMPPTVKILVPVNGYLSPSNLVKFLWSDSDNYGISFYRLFLGDKLLDNTTGTGGLADGLPDGTYQASVETHDLANNTATDTVNFTVDTTPPSIDISNLEEGKYYNNSITPQVNVSDANLNYTSMILNGMAYNESTICDEGNYSLYVYAEDLAGNNASVTVNFSIDKTPPSLYVRELTDNPTVLCPEYSIVGTVEPGALLTVNGSAVAHNGSFECTMNLSAGINQVIVAATDGAGNVATWNKTRLLDSDLLPDYYEINVTHTDPLNGDTNGNNIPDDLEDPDQDGLSNAQEFYIGSDPLNVDGDGDGLNDYFEVAKAGTSPCKADSNENSTTDASEDPDGDCLDNLREQALGTDPLVADTDGDGLADGQEVDVSHTDPLKKDTDEDGMDDGTEVKLGNDPLSTDSNGNGIPDSKEYYTQTFNNTTAGVEVTINGQGDVGKKLFLGMDDCPSPLITNLTGVYKIVKVSPRVNISWALVKVYYDPAQVTDTSALKLFLFDLNTNRLEPIKEQGINAQEHYYWGNVSHFSDIVVANGNEWEEKWYVDLDMPSEIVKPGEEIEISANVHNTGFPPASNVSVEFRANASDGDLIGTTTIADIGAQSNSTASVVWIAKAGVDKIYVNIDSANVIAELNETNNSAYAYVSKVLDSDGDGLTDYAETNGMRVAWPYRCVKTDPFKNDTDEDGLTDGKEMGPIIYDEDNLLAYLSSGITRTKYDGYHYMYKSDPTEKDTDKDGWNDTMELEMGTNPWVPDGGFLQEFLNGYIYGDAGVDLPVHGNLAYLGGTIASSATPGVEYLAMARDIIADGLKSDWVSVTANLASAVLGGLFFADPSPLEEVPIIGAKLVYFIVHYQHLVGQVGHYIIQAFPVDDVMKKCGVDVGLMLLKNYVYKDLPQAITRGLGDAGTKYLSWIGLDLYKFSGSAVKGFIKTADGAKVFLTKHGIDVSISYIEKRSSYLDDVVEVVGAKEYDTAVQSTMELCDKNREEAIQILKDNDITEEAIKNIIRKDLGSTASGYSGEYITAYNLMKRDDLKLLGIEKGFYKYSPNQHGIDFICWDEKNQMYVLIEAKGVSNGKEVGSDLLKDEMSDEWIKNAIDTMENENPSLISKDLAAELRKAIEDNKIRKELYVVQDAPYNENTIGASLRGIIDSVNIIKLGAAS